MVFEIEKDTCGKDVIKCKVIFWRKIFMKNFLLVSFLKIDIDPFSLISALIKYCTLQLQRCFNVHVDGGTMFCVQ